jgi:uncharacterized SAM-binding protein YcdF (DUF218 family)
MQIWTFPPGLILLLMLIGFLLVACGFRSGKKMVVATYILFWLLSTPLVAQAMINCLQKQYSPLQPASLSQQTINPEIVVLGSGLENSPEYSSKDSVSAITMSRVHYAAYLHKLTHADILVSGGNKDNSGRTEAALMRELLQDSYQIPVNTVETTSRNTQEQSTLLVPILKQNNIHRIYLVTNAWHMPRTIYAFKNSLKTQDVQIIPAPMGYISLKSESLFINLLPSLNALNTSAIALHEYTGIIWYHVHHAVVL